MEHAARVRVLQEKNTGFGQIQLHGMQNCEAYGSWRDIIGLWKCGPVRLKICGRSCLWNMCDRVVNSWSHWRNQIAAGRAGLYATTSPPEIKRATRVQFVIIAHSGTTFPWPINLSQVRKKILVDSIAFRTVVNYDPPLLLSYTCNHCPQEAYQYRF